MSTPEQSPFSSTCIRRSRSRGDLAEFGLVLIAVSIDHRLDFDGHDWCLWVNTDSVVAANEELENYERENRPPASPPPRAETVDSGWFGVFGYLLVIWALPTLEGAMVLGWDWREA